MSLNPPTAPEIDALTSFSHRWLVQAHIDSGRNMEAVLALHYPSELFAEYDQKILGAFVLGYMIGASI